MAAHPEETGARRGRRRAVLALAIVVCLAGLLAAALAWRYVAPSASTMAQIRAAVTARRMSLLPMPPRAAFTRGHLTQAERPALEAQVAEKLATCCTPLFRDEQLAVGRVAARAVQAVDERLGSGVLQVPGADDDSVTFVRRNWDGSDVVRVNGADLYLMRQVRGRWLIDDIVHIGA